MSRCRQRGVAVLSATVALLLAMTLSLVYVNRSLMFEQRSMSNQYRALRAFEAAQAGLDWSSAMMNDERSIDDHCTPLAGAAGASFRDMFLKPDLLGNLAPDASAAPGCRLGAGVLADTLRCTCTASATMAPAPGKPPDFGGTSGSDDVVFNLRFEAIAGHARSVRVTSWGCTNASNACDASGADGPMQAVSKVVASFTLRTAPTAGPVTGADAIDSTAPMPAAPVDPPASSSGSESQVPSAASPATSPASPASASAAAPGIIVLMPGSWHDF